MNCKINLKRSEGFYKWLDFKNVMNSTFIYNGNKGKVAIMKMNEMNIELYQIPENETGSYRVEEIKSRKNGYIDHIAFDADDIDRTFSELKQNSFTILEEHSVFLSFWKNGCKYFSITGPDRERLS